MIEVGSFEAKNTLSALLDRVAKGEEVVITRRGKPIARLVGVQDADRRAQARAAAQNCWLLANGTHWAAFSFAI
ncbi:type II toxin-antitoxin system Phd/YefM family antitoxin [Hankyongella ginsenosidimutans]|uniref:Antitoxin n=1 Tax=Hankyongella ginsenosidimutans TaxID=1763828 RepID=A0A4D7CBW6_9SPHN|nr:type II toxin-antitoxin system prevent-host-death family antitoxin [Hankyongella ginsenosidimutans]QCI79272.1 type II toxin-antitoxin system Phd/YefM family antitoxin [Hankyongella ginsenosidimutans]